MGIKNSSLIIKPKPKPEEIDQKYVLNNPIGCGVSLESTQEGFYLKKAPVLNAEIKKSIKHTRDRFICKENKNLYEVEDVLFNSNRFSFDVGFGMSKISYMLGISKEQKKENTSGSILLDVDYKYIVSMTEINLQPNEVWENSTPDYKQEIQNLEKDTENLQLTDNFVNKYGTHLITKADYGYRFRQVFKTNKETASSTKDFKLDSELKFMEYVQLNSSFTEKKLTRYDIDSEVSNLLLLGDKPNVLSRIRGEELTFHWKTDSVYDSEIIDVHPQEYIPLYNTIPPQFPKARENLTKITREKEYELASGWTKTRNYCCVHIEIDPLVFAGAFLIDIELDPYKEKQRTVIKSAKLQKQHVEFINQEYKPNTLRLSSTKWYRTPHNSFKLKVYFKDENVYEASIDNVVTNFIPVDNDNIIRSYNLNWKEMSLDEFVKLHP